MSKIFNYPEFDDRILQFAVMNKLRTSLGRFFEWKEHIFLIDPLIDLSSHQAVRKCAQVGFSEAYIVKAFFMAKYYKMNILYTLPSDSFVEDFVPPKVNKIIDNNPHVFSDIEGNTYQKRIGEGISQRFIYFKGAHNPESAANKEQTSKGVSITTDVNIYDEPSKSDQSVLTQMNSRLSNSKYKGIWQLDNPTYPNMGADAIYQMSDQRHWVIKCSKCGYRQYLDWYRLDRTSFESGSNHTWVDTKTRQIICGKCKKSISDNDRLRGEWVAKYKDKLYRGYWLNQMCYVRHNVTSLLMEEENPQNSSAYFENLIMGKPYIGSDVKLTRSNIVANVAPNPNSKQECAMGIDQGRIKWWVLGNKEGIFAVGQTEDWKDIEKIINIYKPFVVCDALPGQADPKRLSAKYQGRFKRAFYKTEKNQTNLVNFIPDSDEVLIKRNEMIDEIVDSYLALTSPIQMPINELDTYIKHLTNVVRVVKEDSNSNKWFEWVETGDDHFMHATVYFKAALLRANSGSAITQRIPKKEGITSKYPSSQGVSATKIYKNFT